MTQLRRQRNVKIVATLGPASESTETIRALYLAGYRRSAMIQTSGDAAP